MYRMAFPISSQRGGGRSSAILCRSELFFIWQGVICLWDIARRRRIGAVEVIFIFLMWPRFGVLRRGVFLAFKPNRLFRLSLICSALKASFSYWLPPVLCEVKDSQPLYILACPSGSIVELLFYPVWQRTHQLWTAITSFQSILYTIMY